MQINSSVCFLAALLLLILPLDWVAAVVIAAAFHEASHILMLYALGGSISSIQVRASGCVIETNRIGDWEQALSILAGPMGSFSLLLLCRIAPKIAICGLMQCFSNLIPVLPLDGGRLLRLLLYHFCPEQTEAVMHLVTIGICILSGLLTVWLVFATSAGTWPLLLDLVWIISVLLRKIPCKPSQIGVQ